MTQPSNRKELEAKIIAHAWKDSNFKKQLLSDPKAALKQFNCPCPENVQVKVIEEKENTWTLVLLACPAEAKNLTEKDLMALAGGDNPETAYVTCMGPDCK